MVMKKRGWQYAMILMVLTVVWLLPVRTAAYAEETEMLPKAEIADVYVGGYQMAGLFVRPPKEESYVYRIYRSFTPDGEYKLIDRVDDQGTRTKWSYFAANMAQMTGDNKTVQCMVNEVTNEHMFWDTTAVFNRENYYVIQLESTFDDEETGPVSDPACVVPALLAPEIGGGANSANKVRLTYTKVDGAQGYYIYRLSGKQWKRVKTIKKGKTTTWTDKSTRAGKTYTYRVQAFRKSGGERVPGFVSQSFKVTTKRVKVKGNYKRGSVYGPGLNAKELNDVRRVVYSFKANYIRKGMSSYEKVQAAYQYLRTHCSYAYKGWQYHQANTAWGALVYGEAQCSGYARAMKALCDAIGVPCYYVHANERAINPSHQWNVVKVGKNWYIVDVQSGAFLVSDLYWMARGMDWDMKKVPACRENYSA